MVMKKIAKIIIVLLLLIGINVAATEIKPTKIDNLIRAIRIVETGGQPNEGDSAKNKYSSARGPIQVTKPCFTDSIAFDKSIGGKFEDCDHLPYSVKIFHAYMKRYAKKAYENNDLETMARIWNQGLGGKDNANATVYWNKVRKELDKQ